MSYVIDEKNLQRQLLLAETLEKWTSELLEKPPVKKEAKVLDLGCGLGDTTFLLSRQFTNAEVTGLDKDPELIETASLRSKTYPRVSFRTGDVEDLPFEDGHFDFVFLRYLLLHLKRPLHALKEIKRVCKKGGFVMAIEPDFCYLESFPFSDAYAKMRQLFQKVFVEPNMGRKLLSLFGEAGFSQLNSNIAVFPDVTEKKVKQVYTLTGEALELPIKKTGFMSEDEYEAWIAELKRVEDDASCILIGSPSIAVWGKS